MDFTFFWKDNLSKEIQVVENVYSFDLIVIHIFENLFFYRYLPCIFFRILRLELNHTHEPRFKFGGNMVIKMGINVFENLYPCQFLQNLGCGPSYPGAHFGVLDKIIIEMRILSMKFNAHVFVIHFFIILCFINLLWGHFPKNTLKMG